ncbi:hypothetical protein phiLo_25 [Thermus phage phiLo]|nr:hypothetical protein phiLo_25 [Thermus phage phiLo]
MVSPKPTFRPASQQEVGRGQKAPPSFFLYPLSVEQLEAKGLTRQKWVITYTSAGVGLALGTSESHILKVRFSRANFPP